MDDRQRRISANEAMYREVNERLERLNDAFSTVTETFSIMCECGSNCLQQIEMTPEEYRSIREDPELFAVKPGHAKVDVEQVVARRPGYDIVRKRPGELARLAHATDPRS